MHGTARIISDAHSGLKAARRAVYPSIKWQRCQFHLQQNAQSYVPKLSMHRPVAAKLRAIFNAESREEAERLCQQAIAAYETTASKLATWIEENLHEGLTVFDYPEPHHKKRRTRVATLFPNEASCCRLVTAVRMEISEEWASGRRYMVLDA